MAISETNERDGNHYEFDTGMGFDRGRWLVEYLLLLGEHYFVDWSWYKRGRLPSLLRKKRRTGWTATTNRKENNTMTRLRGFS